MNRLFGSDPSDISFCPYRICPLGAHSDHQLGHVTGLAIDRGVSVYYIPNRDGGIEVCSMQFPTFERWHAASVPPKKLGNWADCLRGATLALSHRAEVSVGIRAVIEGTLPIGGLSSSAAVIISFLIALCRVNSIRLTRHEMILTALEAENSYVGVACGKLDQSCEIFSKKDHLLYLDTRDDSYELLPTPPAMKPYEVAVFFSGVERSLAGSAFNMRVDECRSAAYALMAYAGMKYGKFSETNMRDVPREVFEQYRDRLPENFAKRAEHWYTEFDRVSLGVEAWKCGDIEAFGRLSFESGKSSIDNWETGSPELKAIYELMTQTEGIYGGRFSGAGFKGCCMALIDPAFEESIRRAVTEGYLRQFPQYEGKFSVHFCSSADGILPADVRD